MEGERLEKRQIERIRRVTGGEVDQRKDGVKDFSLNVRGRQRVRKK